MNVDEYIEESYELIDSIEQRILSLKDDFARLRAVNRLILGFVDKQPKDTVNELNIEGRVRRALLYEGIDTVKKLESRMSLLPGKWWLGIKDISSVRAKMIEDALVAYKTEKDNNNGTQKETRRTQEDC